MQLVANRIRGVGSSTPAVGHIDTRSATYKLQCSAGIEQETFFTLRQCWRVSSSWTFQRIRLRKVKGALLFMDGATAERTTTAGVGHHTVNKSVHRRLCCRRLFCERVIRKMFIDPIWMWVGSCAKIGSGGSQL